MFIGYLLYHHQDYGLSEASPFSHRGMSNSVSELDTLAGGWEQRGEEEGEMQNTLSHSESMLLIPPNPSSEITAGDLRDGELIDPI